MSVPRQPQSLSTQSTQNKPNRVYQVRGTQDSPSRTNFSFFNASGCRVDGTTPDFRPKSQKSSVSLHLLNAARVKWHLRLSGQDRSESDVSMLEMGTCYLQHEKGDGKVACCDISAGI